MSVNRARRGGRARRWPVLVALGAVGLLGVICGASLALWFVTPTRLNARLSQTPQARLTNGQCLGPRSRAQPGWAIELTREFITSEDMVKVIDEYSRRGWMVIAYSNSLAGFDLLPRRSQRLDIYLVKVEVHEAVTLSRPLAEGTQIKWDYALTICLG